MSAFATRTPVRSEPAADGAALLLLGTNDQQPVGPEDDAEDGDEYREND